jgi:membrane protease YdiL (CAAX protease family)
VNDDRHPTVMEEQDSTEGQGGLATRLHLPVWLRPPAKHQRQVFALQFLPLYIVIAVLLFLVLSTGISYLLPAGTPRLWGALLAKAILAVAMTVPALAISRIEGRPFGDFGLPAAHALGKLFWMGLLWGLCFLSLLLFILRGAGALSYGGVALHGAHIWKLGVFWAVFFLCVALFEEFTFRGYTQFAIQQVAGFWPAALLLSGIFAYIHHSNPGETWFGTLGAGAVALFFCFTLRRTGNLWFAVGMHAAWDWAQSFFYGVPDSGVVEPGHLFQTSLHGPAWLTGGTVGPEGSLLLFVLIAVMWFTFDRLFPATASSPTKLVSPRRHGDTET